MGADLRSDLAMSRKRATVAGSRAGDDLVPPPLPSGERIVCVYPCEGSLWSACEALEYQTFLSCGYTEESPLHRVNEYESWRERSCFHAQLSKSGHPLGVIRACTGDYADMPLGKLNREILPAFPCDPVCEYATLATDPAYRGTGLAERLYRSVAAEAKRDGANGLVAIVDPWLLELLVSHYGFPFRTLGSSQYYMGGNVIAIGMDLVEVYVHVRDRLPAFHDWLIGPYTEAERERFGLSPAL